MGKRKRSNGSDGSDRSAGGMVVVEETGVTTVTRPFREESAAAAGVSSWETQTPPVEMWPVDRLVRHPQNRIVNTKASDFAEFLATIADKGVLEALLVREFPDGGQPDLRQILSGERRFTAASLCGYTHVPVRNLGKLSDAEAWDVVAVTNLHRKLTPLEEGQQAAVWLDQYKQDAEAVASKMGQTAAWVVQHAQIARGLSAEWAKEITEGTDHEERPRWRQWTAGHLAVIARLPVGQQARYLQKVKSGAWYNAPEWSIKRLEDEVKIDLLYLARAPFETGAGSKCDKCLTRTGVQPLLFGETAEQAAGSKERCLDPKCWATRAARAIREDFIRRAQEVAEAYTSPAKGRKLLDPVCPLKGKAALIRPLCLAEPPKGYNPAAEGAYEERVRAAKKGLRDLVTAERITIAKEGDKGAVPGLVVVGTKEKGRQKGALLWVKIGEKHKPAGGRNSYDSPQAQAQRKAEQEKREWWEKACRAAWAKIAKAPRPDDAVLLLCCVRQDIGVRDGEKLFKVLAARHAKDPLLAGLLQPYLDELWAAWSQQYCYGEHARKSLRDLGPFFGVDVDALYQELVPKTKSEKGKKGGKGEAKADACGGDCGVCEKAECSKRTADIGEDLPEDDVDEESEGEQ